MARITPSHAAGLRAGPLHIVPAVLLLVAAACGGDGAPTYASPRAVARVGVTPTAIVLASGATRQVAAIAYDAQDNVLLGRTVTWATDAPDVATVSASGLVRAVGHGYATIIATVDGKTGATAVTVPDPEPAAFDLVFERRPAVGDASILRLSLASGATTTVPLVATVAGAFVRDATPSPDGSRIAFTVAWYPAGVSTLDGDIWVANVDGTGLRQLTTAPELDEQPAWSPDGRRIAFRSRRTGEWDIWAMNADGSGQVNLMTDVLPAASTEQTPAWSPDGARIAYASDIDSFGHARLWTMRADGSDKRVVVARAAGSPDIDRDPTWSPDGTSLAFTRVSPGETGADIVVADLATGAARRIALAGAQQHPAWSPDGARIAFASNHETPLPHLYAMRPDGGALQRLTTGGDENLYPRWLRVP